RRDAKRETEEPVNPRPKYVMHNWIPARDKAADVGREVSRSVPVKAGLPPHRDTEPLPHLASGSVGSDEITRAHALIGAPVATSDDRFHPVLVLLERNQLGRVLEPGAELLGPPAEDRLEAHLRDEPPPS